MKTPFRFALAVSTALGLVTPAMAQEAPRNGDADIVVTARRVEERLQDVPISITVYNQEQVAARNIVSGNDLATYTPSLSANSRFGAETAAFAIRGFTQENFTSPSVGTYFADVIGPRANGGTNAGNGAGVGQFFDLQNVQVLKGPQGTLFGRNTTGGAVLIVPQKPTDELGGYIEGSIGNYDMYRLRGVLNLPLSDTFKVRVGFERQKRDGYINNKSGIGPKDYDDVNYWAVRAAIVADLTPDLENYMIARYSESKTNGTWNKVVGVNATGCRDGIDPVRYPLPASSQVNIPNPVTGEINLASTASFLAPLACSGFVARQKARGDGFWDVDAGNPDPFLRIKQWGVINTTTWRVNDNITLKNIASYQQFRQSQSLYIGNDNFSFPASPNPAWTGLPFTWVGLYPSDGLANAEQETITEELQIQGGTSDGKLEFVLGGYYEKANPLSPFQGSYSPISFVSFSPAPAALGLPAGSQLPFLATLSCSDISQLQCTPINTFGSPLIPSLLQNSLTRYWYENIGFFGQATYNLTEQLAVTGGIRYTIDKTRAEGATRQLFFFAPNQYNAVCAVDNTVPAPSGENCVRGSKQTSKRPTWLINVDYKPTPDILLYAKYAGGYRQGNINASNTIPQGWGPEKVDSYEVGAKASFRGEFSGYFNIAAFYNDFSDQQLAASLIPTPGSTASPAQAIVNAGKSRIQGIEVDALASFSVFSLAAGYTYLDTELQSFTAVDFPGYLPAAPNSDVGGPLPLSPKHKLSVTPSIRLPLDESVGSITLSATYVHTSSQVTAAAAVTPIGTVPAFDLLNLNLAWKSVAGLPVDLSAFVTNVTNEEYFTFVGGGWQSTGIEYGALGMPRMYGLRLKFRFGDFAD